MAWHEAALSAFACSSPEQKCRQLEALTSPCTPLAAAVALPKQPGRPRKPQLVHPAEVPRRKLGSLSGRIALIHAVTHIEFNAINLALDAALRFPDMPLNYYQDWISVAKDEARHFSMLQRRLQELGASYGDCVAHNGLWEMAEKTAHDPLIRMALVPRVLEARGLDVTPGMMARLQAVDDEATVDCLRIILEEEVRHVAIGSRWFSYFCEQQGKEVGQTFIELLEQHLPRRKLATELNEMARLNAGFSQQELAALRAAGGMG